MNLTTIENNLAQLEADYGVEKRKLVEQFPPYVQQLVIRVLANEQIDFNLFDDIFSILAEKEATKPSVSVENWGSKAAGYFLQGNDREQLEKNSTELIEEMHPEIISLNITVRKIFRPTMLADINRIFFVFEYLVKGKAPSKVVKEFDYYDENDSYQNIMAIENNRWAIVLEELKKALPPAKK